MPQSNAIALPAGARERIETAVEAAFARQIATILGSGQLVARRQKARPDDLRRILGRERMALGGLLDAGDDLGLGIGDLPTGQDADAAIDVAPGRHAGGPVAAPDDAGIEVEWVSEAVLAAAYAAVYGGTLPETHFTALTDTRFYGLDYGIPALCFGAKAESIHGFNERVELASLKKVTKTLALFIAGWCGVETAQLERSPAT